MHGFDPTGGRSMEEPGGGDGAPNRRPGLGLAALGLDAASLSVMLAVVSTRPRRRRDPDLSGPWRSRKQVEAAGHEPAVIEALILAGWLVSWAGSPAGPTLGPYLLPTPWGARQMGCVLWDQWERVKCSEERERKVRKIGKKGKITTVTRKVRVKVKRPAEVTRWEDADKAREIERDKPEIRLPADPNLCPVEDWLWATIPDTRPGADPVEEAIAREEATRNARGQPVQAEAGEPVLLMGSQIVIDKRLGPKRAG